MSPFVCLWNIQMERILDMVVFPNEIAEVAYGYFNMVRFHHISDLCTMVSGWVTKWSLDLSTIFSETSIRRWRKRAQETTEIIKFAFVRPAMSTEKESRSIVISHKLTRKVCQCLLLRWRMHDHWHSPPYAMSSSWYRLKPEYWKKKIFLRGT